MKNRTRLLILLCVLLSAHTVFSRGGPGPSDSEGHHRMPLFEKLDLTEEQKESWLSLREEHRQSMQEHRSMHTYRDSIRIELKNDEPRRERLEDLSTKAGEKYSAHTLKMAEYLLELKEILTPEQYEQLLERQGRSPHRGNNRTHRRNH